jgi:hypothetical protein
MIRHILLINWKKDASRAQIDAVVERTRALRALGCIAALQCGGKLGLVEDSWDFALTIDFASQADWQAYQRDPTHAAAAALVRPLVGAFARVQIETA